MRNKVIIGVISLLVVISAAYILLNNGDSATTSESAAKTESSTEESEASKAKLSNQPASATIVYDSNGFSPTTITVKSGETVAVKNSSSSEIQLESGPHPEHTDNPELNLGTVKPGETKAIVVTKTGSFSAHNHLEDAYRVAIIVQ